MGNGVAGDCVLRTIVVVENSAEVATVVSDDPPWEEANVVVSVVSTWDGVGDEVPVVGIWEEADDDVPGGWLPPTLEAAELSASPVMLTTNIAPNPAERVKFWIQQSCKCGESQTQAKVPWSP